MATPAAPLNATTNAIAKGTVVFVQGEAYVRDASGKLSVIKPGDIVVEGQEIITKAGAIVEFELPTGVKVSVGPDRQLLLNDELFATTAPERSENVISSLGGTDAEKVIQALNDGKDPFADLDDTAAGLAGGGIGDQTHDFVRLVRVLENVTPVSYNYTSSTDGIDFLPAGSTTLPANTPPTATADTNLQGTEDQPLNVDVLANDSDPENDPLVVVSASALNGQVTVNPDGSLRYVPKADFNGTDTITYTISDGKGGTSTATATINVAAVNDAPVAIADTSSTPEDTPVTFAVLGNDSDPDGAPLTVSSASVDPTKGSVIVNANGTLTFTPAPNVNGPVTVTYTISDGNGGTATTTAIITVTPLADTAILGTGTGTVKEDTPAQTSASGTLSIVDPDAGQAAFQPQTNVPGTYGSFGV
nr:retention module-containing protein [Zoogloea sp.]